MKHIVCIITALALALASCVKEDAPAAAEERVAVGSRLPAFAVIMNNGTEVSAESLRGKVAVIVFFNTACGDCRKELPIVQEVYSSFEAHPSVEFVAISREEGELSVSAYWTEHGIRIPYSAQTDRRVYELFSTAGIPRIYIADTEGTVRHIHTDADMPSYETLMHEVESVKAFGTKY